MRNKFVEFQQHLYHDIEDEGEAEEHLSEVIPYIGLIVMHFNSLESDLDSVLCDNFTERSDSPGLIVLSKLTYSSKVDLFKRFCDDLQLGIDQTLSGYEQIITNLNESGRLRNMVVHANWESTDADGYTYIKLKMSKKGMKQEYVQFTKESMERITDLILKTRTDLEEFWEHRTEPMYSTIARKLHNNTLKCVPAKKRPPQDVLDARPLAKALYLNRIKMKSIVLISLITLLSGCTTVMYDGDELPMSEVSVINSEDSYLTHVNGKVVPYSGKNKATIIILPGVNELGIKLNWLRGAGSSMLVSKSEESKFISFNAEKNKQYLTKPVLLGRNWAPVIIDSETLAPVDLIKKEDEPAK